MRGQSIWIALILLALCIGGCRDESKIDESDRDDIFRVLRTGVDNKTDPYVRAEVLRTLEILKDPDLASFAEPLKDDASPMVRVIAIRVLLASNHPDVKKSVQVAFNRAKPAERLEVLKATLKYGSPPLQREITARALRGDDPEIRRIAFEHGQLARVKQAIEENNTKYLERTLFPELAHYVDRNDETLGALALKAFLLAGEEDRVEPLIRVFEREDMELEERLKAGRTLAGAHAKGAEPAFLKVIKTYDDSLADDRLGIPLDVVPAELVRMSVIGAVAAGNKEMVPRAKAYMTKSSKAERSQVLEALSENKSAEAEVALRVAMQDALEEVRGRAIELYQLRDDVDPKALIKAMSGTSYTTQRRIALVLMSRYRDFWVDDLRVHLARPSEAKVTLQMLRDVILSRSEASLILVPLKPDLEAILSNEANEKSNLAAYLIAISSDPRSQEGVLELDARFDNEMRYAYLEFLMRETPAAGVPIFRKYMSSDVYVLRLMSAAGLWRVNVAQRPESESESAP